jgi:hypothetical protein
MMTKYAIYLALGSIISVDGEKFVYRAPKSLYTETRPISRKEAAAHVDGREFYKITLKDGGCRSIIERIDGKEKADFRGAEVLELTN